jgi:hypothetical protein
MTSQGDPYRMLGLTPGASVNEIRSAYRRLAKRYHPDAAGDRALPRFLAIQAAYEALVDANGDLRRGPPGSAPMPGSAAPPGSQGEAWRADPSRARASRDAWRARGRSGSTGAAGGPATPPGGPDGQSGQGGQGGQGSQGGQDGPAGPTGTASGSGERRPPGAHTEHHHRRHRRTATPGSTTYDEAGETPLDPAWDGGTWYGASSGTYWTLNPREYADPRKHGPEYRRRAWRAAGQHGPGPSPHAADVQPSPAAPQSSAAEEPPAAAEPSPDRPSPSPATGLPSEGASGTRPVPAATILAWPLPERLLARANGSAPGRALVALVATVPVSWLAAVLVAGLVGCSAGGCPPLVPALAVAAWAIAALVAAALPTASALGAFAVLVAGAGTLVSGAIVALSSGDPVRAVVQAAGTLGAVIYCFALVTGGARMYGRREVDPPEA